MVRVFVRFLSFSLEAGQNCEHDHVSVYNGERLDAANRTAWLCGFSTPPDVTSSANKMLVNFVTDATGNSVGFRAEYSWLRGITRSRFC